MFNERFPLKTSRQLELFEETLGDPIFRANFIKQFSRYIFGKKKYTSRVAHALADRIFDCNLLAKYTWSGIGGEAFKDFIEIQNVFREIMSNRYPNFTEAENIVFFRDKLLRYSKRRSLRKLYKE